MYLKLYNKKYILPTRYTGTSYKNHMLFRASGYYPSVLYEGSVQDIYIFEARVLKLSAY